MIYLIFIPILLILVNLLLPRFRINWNVSRIDPFAVHPFYNVHKWHTNNHSKLLEHELTHLSQQVKLTVIFFGLMYLYYSIIGTFKYGFKKTNRISVGRMSVKLEKKVRMSYALNPFEIEAFIRQNIKVFNKVFPEYKNSKVTAWSHKYKIYKSALIK